MSDATQLTSLQPVELPLMNSDLVQQGQVEASVEPVKFIESQIRQVKIDQNPANQAIANIIASDKTQTVLDSSGSEKSVNSNISKGGVMSIQVVLPDGVVCKSVLNFGEILSVGDLLKVICAKTGLKLVEEYEMIEVKPDAEKLLKQEDEAYSTVMKIKEKKRQLGIRKKKAAVGQRRMNFVSSKSASMTTKPSVVKDNSSSSIESSSNGTAVSQTLPPTANVIEPTANTTQSSTFTTLRRLSSIHGLFNRQAAAPAEVVEAPVIRDFLTLVEQQCTKENSKHITDLPAHDRRNLQMYVADNLAKLFEDCDHQLNFHKLVERGRFLTSSRINTSMKTLTADQTTTKVFGQSLRVVMEAQFFKDANRKVPVFFEQSVKYLYDKGLHSPGIFRISGVARKVKALKDDVDSGRELVFTADDTKPHDVTGMLKQWFREMPDPLLTFKLFDYYIAAAKHLQGKKLDYAVVLISYFLPVANIYILEYFLKLLNVVAQNCATISDTALNAVVDAASPEPLQIGNQMTANNLAIVIAPNILRSKDEKAQNLLNVNDLITIVVENMIDKVDNLFQVHNELMQAMAANSKSA